MGKKNLPMTIALAEIDEIGFVVELHSRIYTKLGYGLAIQKHIMSSLIRFIDSYKEGRLWIAKVNGVKVGTIGLVLEEQQWKIRWFLVDSAYQGLGIGKELLETLMQFVMASPIEHLELGTIDELIAARALYTAYGFQLTQSQPTNQWKEHEVVDEVWEWRRPSNH